MPENEIMWKTAVNQMADVGLDGIELALSKTNGLPLIESQREAILIALRETAKMAVQWTAELAAHYDVSPATRKETWLVFRSDTQIGECELCTRQLNGSLFRILEHAVCVKCAEKYQKEQL